MIVKKLLIIVFLFVCCFSSIAQEVDFEYRSDGDNFCNPALISFSAVAPGAPQGYVWTLGNGTLSNSKNPSVRYTRAGDYNVELLVIYKTYTRRVVKTIKIHSAITATIKPDRDYICAPGDIEFTATSNLPAQYEWNFGDGATEITGNNSVSHTYGTYQSFDVSVKATSDAGCTVTATTKVRLQKPAIRGTSTNNSGCVPVTSRLSVSASIPESSNVTSYTWNFNDGSAPQTTVARAVNHTFSNAGNFAPSVTITTSEGCTNTFDFNTLAYGTPPENLTASAEEYVFCGSDSAVFVANAVNANFYVWDFGDGKTAETSENTIRHKYSTLGIKTVTVTPYYNDCPAPPASFDVEVIGVIASFRYKNTCADKKTFELTNTSRGKISSMYWRIEDGSSDVFSNHVTHTYPDDASTRTLLHIEDSITGCKATAGTTIYTANPFLTSSDTSVCRGADVSFAVADNYGSSRATYTWSVAGDNLAASSNAKVTVNADSLGIFENSVIINLGTQYCKDTLRLMDVLRVHGPQLSFTGPDEVCFSSPYEITNHSKAFFPEEEILLWHWNYGETTVNDTIYQPDPYFFSRSGKYKIKLQAIDNMGCTDSLMKEVRINPLPFLYLVPQASTLCLGETDSLFAFYNGTLDWRSDINLPCNDCDTLVFAPQRSGIVIARATTNFGCTVEDSIALTVHQPFTARAIVEEPYICLNDSTKITVTPAAMHAVWEPQPLLWVDSSFTAIAAPRETTTYSVTLSDSIGCFSSTATATVHIKSLPEVNAGPDQILPYNSPFHINPQYSTNIASYNWSPSRSLSCETCPAPSGILMESESYRVEVVSDSGCVASDSINIVIECKDANLLIPNAFTPNGDNLNDVFYPIGRGIKNIKVFAVFDRFGKLVFERKDFSPNEAALGWDGKRKGVDQDGGVFVFYLEAECFMGEIIKRRGSVTLLK